MLIIRIIKIIDIMFITTLYACTAFFLGILLERYVYPLFFDESDEYLSQMPLGRLLFLFCFVSGIIGAVSYIGRNVVQLIPFPLEGVYGFSHLRVKEVSSGAVLTTFLFLFSGPYSKLTTHLKAKVWGDDKQTS
jgi:hypothetical protein